MEENAMQGIEMAAAILLFIFALSSAVYSYTNMMNILEDTISINITSEQGKTAEQVEIDPNNIKRQADAAEIIMSALNLEKTVKSSGNNDYSINIINGTVTFSVSYDVSNNYAVYRNETLGVNIGKFSTYPDVLVNMTGVESFDKLVEKLNDVVADSKYYVTYTDVSITYTKIWFYIWDFLWKELALDGRFN